MMFYQKTIFIIVSCLLVLGFSSQAQAAKLYLSSEERSFSVGEEFSVYVKIDTELEGINAVEALISFPQNILEVTGIKQDDSVFNFWLSGPDYSNQSGAVNFIGGTPKGVSGSALQVIEIDFKTVGAGSADIKIDSAVVTASDGQGTNILSVVEGLNIGVGTEALPIEQALIPESEETVPERIEREAVPAGQKPASPVIAVPLYPDSSKWYSHLGDVVVFWEVPDDVVKIATQIDSNPNGDPQTIENELFNGKNFGAFTKDGVWYLHVQFKNNVGWGERTHYKISLDTTPPLPFEAEIDNEASDNPSPEIYFETHDNLSGVAFYRIFIDDQPPLQTDSNSIVLPVQFPGKHSVRVKAVDFAGNGVEDVLEFEVLPLLTPTIDFLTKTAAQEESVLASGRAEPEAFVDIWILDKTGQEAFSGTVQSNELGNWKITIEEVLKPGIYYMTARARDARGAVSYQTETETLKIKAKTILSLGVVDLGWFEIMLIAVLLVISGSSLAAWYYVSTKKTREAYKVIVGRDIEKFSTMVSSDVKEMKSWLQKQKKNISAKDRADAEHILKSLSATAVKIKKYLTKSIKKLK